MSHDRHEGRVLAMQALCQWDAQGGDAVEALSELLESHGASRRPASLARALVRTFVESRENIDRHIDETSSRWNLSRMSPVDRNVIRVAVVELLQRKAPPKVILNEAIEIARAYGGHDSPRFINGVLDEVLRQLRDERPSGDDSRDVIV